jgi:hypothetical protein
MILPNSGYSADVRLELRINGQALPVEQTGPESCLLVEPIDHPPCDGELVIHIDGRRHVHRVNLPEGISRQSKRVVFG